MERKDYQGSVIKVQAKRIEHEDLVDLIRTLSRVGNRIFQNDFRTIQGCTYYRWGGLYWGYFFGKTPKFGCPSVASRV